MNDSSTVLEHERESKEQEQRGEGEVHTGVPGNTHNGWPLVQGQPQSMAVCTMRPFLLLQKISLHWPPNKLLALTVSLSLSYGHAN